MLGSRKNPSLGGFRIPSASGRLHGLRHLLMPVRPAMWALQAFRALGFRAFGLSGFRASGLSAFGLSGLLGL